MQLQLHSHPHSLLHAFKASASKHAMKNTLALKTEKDTTRLTLMKG